MLRFSTICLFGLLHVLAQGQIVPVSYRGAFAPAPTPMWTDGWAEWNPNAANYPAPTVVITGKIAVNTIWTSNNVYELSGVVSINENVSLTIEPGTIIRGDNNVPNSCLIVTRGAKLFAIGTAARPIVFTSDKAAGTRAPGDWGGVIILGKAQTNTTSGVGFIEGLNNIPESQYGGGLAPNFDINDNSGVLSYARIEFGGFVFQDNVEINGLTMGAVGRGTQIDHIQCSFINDDSYEWFGGSVNASHLIAYRGVDDNWDTDNGYSGKVQFCLGVRDPNLWDPTFANVPPAPAASSSEGFESDNDAGASNNNPRTSAIFSNVTEIGPFRGTAQPAADLQGFRRAGRIRRNSQLSIVNTILMDWRSGVQFDGAGTDGNAINGNLIFRNNIIAGASNNRNIQRLSNASIATYMGVSNIDSVPNTIGLLVRPYEFFTPDYRPAPGSLALSNFSFNDPLLPVTISELKGINEKGTNYLTWKTTTEQNNAGFDIERSANGQQFTKVGYVSSLAVNGNSSATLSYNFEDVNPIPGVNFYRLKQKDTDGRFAFSNVIVLNSNTADELTMGNVFPNPANNGVIRMVVISPEAQEVNFRISDVSGRIVSQRDIPLNQGINNLEWNVRNFGAGSYFIQAIGTGIKPQKFIKQ